MTNEQIVMHKRIELMKSNLIKSTGETIEVSFLNENGDEETHSIPEPEVIHTYAGWKERGFQVKKGEHSIAQFPIWKHTIKKAKTDDEKDETKMFMKKASWFTASQVEPIKEG